jgi:hypothetical protein
MEKNIIEVNNKQLWVIQKALDFFSRVGIGQWDEILNHPTYETHTEYLFRDKNPLKVGDETERGTVVEINKKGKWIKTEGSWGNGKEIKKWTDVQNVKKSTDWEKVHNLRDEVKQLLTNSRNTLIQDFSIGSNGSWGIHNSNVDDSCRVAFDIIQVIRHQRWLANPERTSYTVDSHISLTSDSHNVKVKLDENV